MRLNGENIDCKSGETILELAERAGVAIPTLCHLKGEKPFASCMVCVVEDSASGKLLPACSTLAQPDMDIKTDSPLVVEERLCAIELLLSEHLGDCEGPCRLACPAYLNVPDMIRRVVNGDLNAAERELRGALAFPRIISRVCDAPCEKGCRRGRVDESVSIKALARFVVEASLAAPERVDRSDGVDGANPTHPSVAVVGGGPAGLACAFHLSRLGIDCEVFESKSECWGGLYNIPEETLPRRILDEELENLRSMGVKVRLNSEIGDDALRGLRSEFSAVVIAVGANQHPPFDAASGSEPPFALEYTERGIHSDSASFATSLENVYALGDALLSLRKSVRSVADAKLLAERLAERFSDLKLKKDDESFNSRFGKLFPGDLDEFMKIADKRGRSVFVDSAEVSSRENAIAEAERCMECDCAAAEKCRLRELADKFGAKQKRRASRVKDERRGFIRILDEDLLFEPGKCVKCGRCLAVCAKFAEKRGPGFVNRGYDMEIAFPFGVSPKIGLGKAAAECVDVCPTGAIAWKIGKRVRVDGTRS
jgi:thioredoxin reductase/ferredoxin